MTKPKPFDLTEEEIALLTNLHAAGRAGRLAIHLPDDLRPVASALAERQPIGTRRLINWTIENQTLQNSQKQRRKYPTRVIYTLTQHGHDTVARALCLVEPARAAA